MLYRGLLKDTISASNPRLRREQLYFNTVGLEGIQCFNRTMSNGQLIQKGFKSQININDFKLSPDGESLYFSLYSSRVVTKFGRSMVDGTLSYITNGAIAAGNFWLSNNAVVDDIQISPDSNYVYACSRYGGAITVFSKNMSTLSYTVTGTIASPSYPGDIGSGPVSMALSKTDKLYVNNPSQGNLQTFIRNVSTGALTSSWITPFNLLGMLLISPDDKNIYLWTNTTIEVFTAGSSLSHIQSIGYTDIRSIVFSKDGKFLYIGTTNNIIYLNRDTITGTLSTPVNNVMPRSSNYGNLIVSKDNKYMYSSTDHAIESYTRNEVTGSLYYNGQYSSTYQVYNIEATSL